MDTKELAKCIFSAHKAGMNFVRIIRYDKDGSCVDNIEMHMNTALTSRGSVNSFTRRFLEWPCVSLSFRVENNDKDQNGRDYR